ncbi:ATP-binding protein [Planctomycetota bacterium]
MSPTGRASEGADRTRDPLTKATALYRGGLFHAALTVLEELLQRRPEMAVAHYLKGIVFKDAGNSAEAVAAFDRAYSIDPGIERIHYHRGTARFLAADKPGAFHDLSVAVKQEPGFLFAVYNLGVASVALRRWDDAKQAFGRCLELDPANRTAYVELLVEIGRSSAQEEAYSQGHRIKNMIGVVGDQHRTIRAELEQLGEAVPASLRENATRLGADLRAVYEDLVRFLRAVDQEPPDVDLIDMAELLEKCLFALSPRLRNMKVERIIESWMPEVIGDRRSLAEALVNVLTNAIEACQPTEGHEPAIAVTMGAVDDCPAVEGVDSIRIEIRDTGPGIDEEVMPHIFELGYTTKRFGTGIGLSYTERVVRAHGGRVDIQSSPGVGTAVTLVLPASPVGVPNLRTLSLRSLLFEDLRPLAARG